MAAGPSSSSLYPVDAPPTGGGTEDFVECGLYSAKVLRLTDADEQGKELKRLKEAYSTFVGQWTADYIWQKDPFRLKVVSGSASDNREGKAALGSNWPHLRCRARFGESVDDEWFIVWLLFQLSEYDPELVISVVDNDGQFLLIEAALVLPRWIKPENTKNRVWIHQGNLHIIPLPRTPAELTQIPQNLEDIGTTIALVLNPKIKTFADQPVQQAIKTKIEEYPDKARQFHYARCCLPWQVARILNERPQLIAPAIEAFYHRDLDGMFMCSKMEKFTPGPVVEGPDSVSALQSNQAAMVMTMVRFSRCLYAMLACQKFEPPKLFAPFVPPEEHPDHQAFMLGIKIAAGFEILYDIPRKRTADHAAAAATHDVENYDFNADKEWQAFAQTLNGLGYFEGEVKGSREYQRKLSVAKKKYLEDKYRSKDHKPDKGKRKGGSLDDDKGKKMYREEIDNILSRPFDPISFQRALTSSLRPDDDSSWMNITPQEVDDLLAQKQKEFEEFEANETERKAKKQKAKELSQRNVKNETATEEGDMRMLMDLIGGMKNFMGKVSSYEGAEFPTQKDAGEDISFDADRFIKVMRQTLEGDVDGMNLSEELTTDDSEEEEPDEFFGMGSDDDDDEDEEEIPELGRDPNASEELRMRRLMKEMDRELRNTKLAADFEKVPAEALHPDDEQKELVGGEEDLRPVDVNLNLVKNILDSIEAEAGLAGPSSNLLKELRDLTKETSRSENQK